MERIIYNQFPTHVAITNNKKAPNKYIKISGQAIYNGTLGRFQRATAVSNLHNYLIQGLPQSINITYPFITNLEFYAPINYGNVRRIKGQINWKPPKEDYIPTWDIDNQWIWIKLFNDVLQEQKLIPKDTVKDINGLCIKYYQIDNLNDRKLIFNLT